ncbi:hypothetical protein [Thalassotalea piscium]|uniref:Uncharacterized protein n=1 Tax=Thalassotalea piscium TaxID=1230533 RepID=A0A7X0NE67_9GAMM|nr:hypothetical protein [Thalassotalea piscium]MBB6541782.1 hypothetical protein [Thalassotalea piscium]
MSNTSLDNLAIKAIELLQCFLGKKQLTAHIHFELEGCVRSNTKKTVTIDFAQINKAISALGIEGELVPEYWRNQWEFVSIFAGQSPLKEAHNLTKIMYILPRLFRQQGIEHVLINPVIWGGDQAELLLGSKNIFQGLNKSIHIPNAIQINVSISDANGNNLIATTALGEYLQQCFINTSFDCALLFLPEHDAFERLKLKSDYGLNDELCSPIDISGGHQGSIALYRKYGKHNQTLGEDVLIVNHLSEPLVKQVNWEKTARIEHRLGAASLQYNAYVNVVFTLLNVVDAVKAFEENNRFVAPLNALTKPLPLSLYDEGRVLGAYSLFKKALWFEQRLNEIEHIMLAGSACLPEKIGSKIKNTILDKYCNKKIVFSTRTDGN